MAGSLLGAAAGAAASAAIGAGANALFGSKTPKAKTSNITAGGFESEGNSRKTVTSTPERLGLVNNLRSLFERQAGELGNLRPLVKPGFGRLTESRVNTLENRGAARIGNLRQNLSRRRVAGSSFGQGQIQSEMRQLDQDISEVKARSFLEELDLTTQLIDRQYASDIAAVETVLNNLNLEANIGLQLATGAQSALNQNAAIQAQLAIANAEGIGALVQPFASAAGSSVSNFFSP